jgi:hypothetical protein
MQKTLADIGDLRRIDMFGEMTGTRLRRSARGTVL